MASNAASPCGLPILAAVALGAVLAGLLLSSLQRPRFGGAVGRGGRPDLVLIVADDLGFNDVGYNHAGGPGKHILNLGHGVLQGTPEENVAAFVDAAKSA